MGTWARGTALAALVLALPGTAMAAQDWPVPTAEQVSLFQWRESVLAALVGNRTLDLLVPAQGSFAPCGLSEEIGGGAAVQTLNGTKTYGCWVSALRDGDSKPWVVVQMPDGPELTLPMAQFRKESRGAPADLWSEENYQQIGKRASVNINALEVKVNQVVATVPTLPEAQKRAALACLRQVKQIMVSGPTAAFVEEQHAQWQAKWAGRTPSAAENDEQRNDMGVVIGIAEAVSRTIDQANSHLDRCLSNGHVDI